MKKAGSAGGKAGSVEDKAKAGRAGSVEDKAKAGRAGSVEDKAKAGKRSGLQRKAKMALVITKCWLVKFLAGKKVREIRSSPTRQPMGPQ